MRTIKFLLQKEFLQIFRNKGMLPIIFVMPLVQLLVLSYAATYDLKEVHTYLVDMDQSHVSRELIRHFEATGYYKIDYVSSDKEGGIEQMRRNNVDLILHIPANFEKDLQTEGSATVQLAIDAVNGFKAGLIQSYSQSIIQQYNQNLLVEMQGPQPKVAGLLSTLTLKVRNWYNLELDYINYMVPGILVVLITMIGAFLSGMNIVRERELGTIEQLNVTPIKKYQFMVGKLMPLWIIGLFELAFGLVIARWLFGIPFVGSILLIFGIAAVYLLAVQGLGLLISTVTHTQQQAMFIAWFIMVVFILMGGLFTPIESMPLWAQKLTWVNPIAYFIKIMRMVLLKGAGFGQVWEYFTVLVGMVVVFLGGAILRYRKAES